MKYKLYLSVLIAGIILSGCENFFETTIDIDPPPQIKALVLNGRAFCGERVINFRITESLPVLSDEKFITPENLNINLTLNGNSIRVDTAMIFDVVTGKYILGYHRCTLPQPLKTGDKVTITASHPNHKSISVTDSVPAMADVPGSLYTHEAGSDLNGYFSYVDFDLKPTTNLRYYNLALQTRKINCNNPPSCSKFDTIYENRSLEFNDPDFITNGNNAYLNTRGNTGIKSYRGRSPLNSWGGTPFARKPRLTITVFNEKYYNFLVSRKQYEDASDNPFSSPVNIISNVAGGLGVFGLGNRRTVLMVEK